MQKNSPTIEVSTSKSHSTLIQLYQRSQHLNKSAIIRYNRAAKPTHFLELAIFKQQRNNEFSKAHSYDQYFSKVRFYKMFFFALSMIFLTLGIIIFFQNVSFHNHFYGDLRHFIKNAACIFTASLAFFAALIGRSLCVTKEATQTLAKKAKRRLGQIYTRKRIENGVRNFFFNPYRNSKAKLLKLAYVEMLLKIEDIKSHTADLLRDIRASGFDKEYQEKLFCQALAEMDQQLKQHLVRFKEQDN